MVKKDSAGEYLGGKTGESIERENGSRQQAEPIRILHVLGRLDRGGAETMVMNLYRQIDRSCIQFDFVLHTEEECAYSEEVRLLGGRIFSVPAFAAARALHYRHAWEALLAGHPEWKVLHSHIRSTASLYLPIARQQGIHTIIHSHNTASGSGLSAVVKTLLQYPLRFQADELFACSLAAGEWLYGRKACGSSRFHLLKNAIDTGHFAYREEKRKRCREALGISREALVIGHVGRFEEQKNHRFLLDIFAAFQQKIPDAVLLLIGEGGLEKAVKHKAEELGLSGVHFLGVRTDVDELLCAMDVFLFPSLFEGLPVTLIEAQATGLPVIASDTITDEVKVTPLVQMCSPFESAEKWADAVGRIYGEHGPQSRTEESENAVRAIGQAGYDITQTADWLERFYEAVWPTEKGEKQAL